MVRFHVIYVAVLSPASSCGLIFASDTEINLIEELSRIKRSAVSAPRSDSWGYRKAAIFRIVGRHLLNVWRIMRGEIDLTSYRFENMVFHLLHQRYECST